MSDPTPGVVPSRYIFSLERMCSHPNQILSIMECPRNLERCASQLFNNDKTSLEYQALLVASKLPHPQRAILASFISASVDRNVAAQYLLSETSSGDVDMTTKFLSDWTTLVRKCRII